MSIKHLSAKTKLDMSITKTKRAIELTEQKLKLLHELLASLQFAKANNIDPNNIQSRQLDLPF